MSETSCNEYTSLMATKTHKKRVEQQWFQEKTNLHDSKWQKPKQQKEERERRQEDLCFTFFLSVKIYIKKMFLEMLR